MTPTCCISSHSQQRDTRTCPRYMPTCHIIYSRSYNAHDLWVSDLIQTTLFVTPLCLFVRCRRPICVSSYITTISCTIFTLYIIKIWWVEHTFRIHARSCKFLAPSVNCSILATRETPFSDVRRVIIAYMTPQTTYIKLISSVSVTSW